MIPFEALIPWGIIFGFVSAAGAGMSAIHSYRNYGKRDRYGLDQFERQCKLILITL